MLMENGEWGVGNGGDQGKTTNAQYPIPNYDMSIFFFFLKGTRTKL